MARSFTPQQLERGLALLADEFGDPGVPIPHRLAIWKAMKSLFGIHDKAEQTVTVEGQVVHKQVVLQLAATPEDAGEVVDVEYSPAGE